MAFGLMCCMLYVILTGWEIPSNEVSTAVNASASTPNSTPEQLPASVPDLINESSPVPQTQEEGIRVISSPQKASSGQEIAVIVEIHTTGQGISGSEIALEFDPLAFEVTGLAPGDLMGNGPLVGAEEIDNQNGIIHYALARKGITQITDSSGVLAIINLRITDSATGGTCNLTLKEINLTNERFEEINGLPVQNGVVEIAP
jgi:hypothetical protein